MPQIEAANHRVTTVTMTIRSQSPLALAALLCLGTGCYSGIGMFEHDSSSPEGEDNGEDSADDDDQETGDDGSDVPPVAADCPGPDQPRRLNRMELNMVAQDLFGVGAQPFAGLSTPGDVSGAKVGRQLGVSEAWVDTYTTAVEAVAQEYITREGLLDSCSSPSCLRPTLEHLAHRMLRRPVESERVDGLIGIIETSLNNDLSLEEGLVSAIVALFLTPEFLYIGTHVGAEPGVYELDDYEVATRLSLALWNSIPDEALLAAAEAGELSFEEGIRAQVDRMLADPDKGSRFIETWTNSSLFLAKLDDLALEVPAGVELSQPQWSALLSDMKAEALMTMRHTFEQGEDIETLVESGYVFVNQRLAEHYGIEGIEGEDLRQVELPVDSPYGGLMTSGANLLQHHDIIHRGVSVLEAYLCRPIGAPSDEATLARIAEQLESAQSEEELAEIRMSDAACNGCHNSIDPLGIAFTQFDHEGRYSSTDEEGQPIEIDIEFHGTPLHGPQDVRQLILDEGFASCFVPGLLGPIANREMKAADSADACATDELLTTLGGDTSLRSIVEAALVSGTFRTRIVGEPPE